MGWKNVSLKQEYESGGLVQPAVTLFYFSLYRTWNLRTFFSTEEKLSPHQLNFESIEDRSLYLIEHSFGLSNYYISPKSFVVSLLSQAFPTTANQTILELTHFISKHD